MCALYAFMRITDDLSDGPGTAAEKSSLLDQWRRSFDQALSGRYSHPLHPALAHTMTIHAIPPEYLHAVLDGVCMDLAPVRYDTFSQLYRYCYHVASAVGLACIHVWGFERDEAKIPAEAAGIAFQMTNILRDLAEDASRGRVYLPCEDLERFGYTREQLCRGERDAHFRALMAFEVERARGYYEKSRQLTGLLQPAGRAVFRVMAGTYRGLLEAIVQRDYDVFSSRVRLSRWHKLWLVLQALPMRWLPD
jgi:phytoene synthase